MNIWERIHNILTDWGLLPHPSVQYTSIGWRPDPWNQNDGMTETSPGEFTSVPVAGIPRATTYLAHKEHEMVKIEITEEAIEWFENEYGDDKEQATEAVQMIVNLCRISGEEKKIFNFDQEIKWILGQPNFACLGIANALRKGGVQIEKKSEAEQAAVIYWMLEMYLMHGKNWRKAGEEFLRQVNA